MGGGWGVWIVWERPWECPCHPRKIIIFHFTIFPRDGKNLSWSEFSINKETNKALPAVNIKMLYTTQMVVMKDAVECFSIWKVLNCVIAVLFHFIPFCHFNNISKTNKEMSIINYCRSILRFLKHKSDENGTLMILTLSIQSYMEPLDQQSQLFLSSIRSQY